MLFFPTLCVSDMIDTQKILVTEKSDNISTYTVTEKIYLSGIQDDFNQMNTEQSAPSVEFSTYLSQTQRIPLIEMDIVPIGKWIAHSFQQLTTGVYICSAKLECKIYSDHPLASDDRIICGTMKKDPFEFVTQWESSVSTLVGYTWGEAEQSEDIIIQWNRLNPNDSQLLDNVLTFGRLDICIGDYTAVDFLKLTLEMLVYNGGISGTVVSSVVGYPAPVNGMSVTLIETGMQQQTAMDGKFIFSNLKEGIYSLSIVSNHFQPVTIEHLEVENRMVHVPVIDLNPCACDSCSSQAIQTLIQQAIQKYDPSLDGRVGLEEAIHSLQTIINTNNLNE